MVFFIQYPPTTCHRCKYSLWFFLQEHLTCVLDSLYNAWKASLLVPWHWAKTFSTCDTLAIRALFLPLNSCFLCWHPLVFKKISRGVNMCPPPALVDIKDSLVIFEACACIWSSLFCWLKAQSLGSYVFIYRFVSTKDANDKYKGQSYDYGD